MGPSARRRGVQRVVIVRLITPVDSVQRAVMMAIERGELQNLIFDDHALASHRAMAAILGAILKLPPVEQTLANKQMQRSTWIGCWPGART